MKLNIYKPITCSVEDLDTIDYFLIQAYDNQVLDAIEEKGFSIKYFYEDFYICKKLRRE